MISAMFNQCCVEIKEGGGDPVEQRDCHPGLFLVDLVLKSLDLTLAQNGACYLMSIFFNNHIDISKETFNFSLQFTITDNTIIISWYFQ